MARTTASPARADIDAPQGICRCWPPTLTPERLERGGLLISIGPAREFSSAERNAVKQFVAGGRDVLCMVGGEEHGRVAPLLSDFNFKVPHSPVPPGRRSREPAPLGVESRRSWAKAICSIQFYAAWPVECDSRTAQTN